MYFEHILLPPLHSFPSCSLWDPFLNISSSYFKSTDINQGYLNVHECRVIYWIMGNSLEIIPPKKHVPTHSIY